MSRSPLTSIRPGTWQWWGATLLFGYLVLGSIGYAVVAVRSPVELAGSLILPALGGAVLFVLLAKHPAIAGKVVDDAGNFRPWAARIVPALLTLAFGALGIVAAVSDVEGRVPVLIVSALFVLLFGFLLVRAWSGSHPVSAATFGIHPPPRPRPDDGDQRPRPDGDRPR